MWKTKWEFEGKSNMQKHNIYFVLVPTIGIMTGLYNTKTSYNIALVWLFFQVEVEIRWI